MLPDHLPNVDPYFDLVEHLALRTFLLMVFLLALYRLIRREWERGDWVQRQAHRLQIGRLNAPPHFNKSPIAKATKKQKSPVEIHPTSIPRSKTDPTGNACKH